MPGWSFTEPLLSGLVDSQTYCTGMSVCSGEDVQVLTGYVMCRS